MTHPSSFAVTLITLQNLDSFSREKLIDHVLQGTEIPEGTKETIKRFGLMDQYGEVPHYTVDAIIELRKADKI